MADDKEAKKEHKKEHKIYKAGDKYMCGECGSEVTFEAPTCPTCKVNLNWVDVLGHVR